MTEIAEKVSLLAVAQNILRSPENHFTLLDISKGQNKNGEKLAEGDFIFEYEKPAIGLNDRPMQVTVTISRDNVLNREKTSA